MDGKVRLQKIMAAAGIGSRRHNEKLIKEKRVQVNGQVAWLGQTADITVDTITIDGEKIEIQKPIYVIMNKPKGVLSSNEDELDEDRPTVRKMLSSIEGHLYPVGRLDKQSEGLILMTNDGNLAHHLTHPRYEHRKRYMVTVEGSPSIKTLKKWEKGVMLEEKMTAPARVRELSQDEEAGNTLLRIDMTEGRKRQIRRVAALLEHPVQKLVRVQLGSLRLGDLPAGEWRYLTDEEIDALQEDAQKQAVTKPKQKKQGDVPAWRKPGYKSGKQREKAKSRSKTGQKRRGSKRLR